MQFDHIGVLARSLRRGRTVLESAVGIEAWTQVYEDEINGVLAQFGRDASGICYELLEPLGEDSPIRAALTDRRAILNHVAYRVPDLDAAAERMRESGSAPVGQPNVAIAYGGQRIQFFVTPLSFVVELIEAPSHVHPFDWQTP